MKLRFYALLLIALISSLVGLTLMYGYDYQFSLKFYALRILGVVVVIALMLRMLIQIKDSEKSDWTKNAVLTIITLIAYSKTNWLSCDTKRALDI